MLKKLLQAFCFQHMHGFEVLELFLPPYNGTFKCASRTQSRNSNLKAFIFTTAGSNITWVNFSEKAISALKKSTQTALLYKLQSRQTSTMILDHHNEEPTKLEMHYISSN